MKMLKYEYFCIKHFYSPLKIENEAFERTDNLLSTLENLFPVKSEYFKTKRNDTLSISLLPTTPIYLDTDVFINSFFNGFDNFKRAISSTRYAFKLQQINIISSDEYKSFKGEGIISHRKYPNEKHTGILIDLFEFYQLYKTVECIKINGCFVFIFIDFNNCFCFYVPIKTPFKKLFSIDYELRNYVKQNPTINLYNPISNEQFNIETDTVNHKSSLIFLSNSNYNLLPKKNFLLPFPYFAKKIKISKEQKKSNNIVYPCCNCLSCVDYCPSRVYPNYLYHLVINNKVKDALELNLLSCIQCGICNYVCPSNIPLFNKISEAISSSNEGQV